MISEAKEWLEKAKSDFSDAEYNFKGNRYSLVAFLCQQAAEKALKALYVKKFKKLWKTHDLKLLAEEVGAPSKIIELATELTPAYLIARYPEFDEDYDETEIKHLMNCAKEVIDWVEKNLQQ